MNAARSSAAELTELTALLRDLDAPFDDLARARAESQLLAAVDAPAPADEPASDEHAPPRRSRLARLGLVASAVAAAAALLVVLVDRRAPAYATPATLRPFVIEPIAGAAPPSGAPPALADAPQLIVPDGWMVRATLGDAATVTLIGPAELAVTREGAITTARLARGRLLGTLDPHAHQRLRVVTATVVVDVVGTVFSVTSDPAGADRVAVLHGSVRVARDGASADVDGGHAWRAGAWSALGPVDRAELEEHERAVPPSEPSVAVTLSGGAQHADVWLGDRHLARTPAWVRLAGGSEVRLSAEGFAATTVRVPDTQGAATNAISFALAPAPPVPAAVPAPAPAVPSLPATTPRSASAAIAAAPRAPAPAPPAVEPPAPPSPADPAAARTAASLYGDADRALAAGDRDGVRTALRALVDSFPEDPLADTARYQLATLARAAGDPAAAISYLAHVSDPLLAEPVDYLRCQALVDEHAQGAADCLLAFRRAHAGSPHDADAIALLAGVYFDAGDCAAARPLLAAYLAARPDGRIAAAARARLARCDAARATPAR